MRRILERSLLVTALAVVAVIALHAPAVEAATTPPTMTQPVTGTTYGPTVPIAFNLPQTPLSSSVKLTFSGSATRILTLSTSTSGNTSFTLHPANPLVTDSANVASMTGGSSIPDGTYTVTLSYQNQVPDSPASVFVTNITLFSAAATTTSFTPSNNAADVSIQATLQAVFNQAMAVGSGNFVIHKVSDNSVVQTIAANSANVTGGGTNTITINLPTALANGTAYYVTIDSSALSSQLGNTFAGVSSTTAWQFTTLAAAPVANVGTVSAPNTGGGAPAPNSWSMVVLLVSLLALAGGLVITTKAQLAR